MRRIAVLLLLLSVTRVAHADWPRLVCSTSLAVNGLRDALIFDLPSGDLGVLGVGLGGNDNYYNLQRISRDGTLAAGWPAEGTAFTEILRGYRVQDQSFVADDSGNVWRAWAPGDFSTSVEFISPGGVHTPSPFPTYFSIGTTNEYPVGRVTPGPGSDAFVACGAWRLKRITSTGATAAGWPANGVAMPGGSIEDYALAPDGSGGVVAFLHGNATTGLPTATRIDAGGAVHAGWPLAGIVLSGLLLDHRTTDARLLPSGSGHFLAVWTDYLGNDQYTLTMQRFGLDATIDPAWPANGVVAIAADSLLALTVVPDGSGGAYLLRLVNRLPVATHVGANGAVVGTAAASVLDASARYVHTRVANVTGIPDKLIADRTPDGGLLVGWNDTRLAPTVSFRLRWLKPDLTLAAGTLDTGLVYFPGPPIPSSGALLTLHADNLGGAWIAWKRSNDVWMTHVPPPTGVVAVAPTAPTIALALSASRPNPVHGAAAFDVMLPDASPARVDLVDLAGRLRRTRSVQGVGSHVITFVDLEALAPGVYFARLTCGASSRSTRLVVTH